MWAKIKRFVTKYNQNSIYPLYYTQELSDAYLGTSVCGGSLKGETVIITGATGGIGKALAVRFMLEGCHVVLAGRNENKLKDLKGQLYRVVPEELIDGYIVLDLQNKESIENAVAELQEKRYSLDILVNNAGVYTDVDKQRKFRDVTTEEFFHVWNINFEGTVMFTKLLLPIIEQSRGRKKVINISSICAEYRSFQYTPYGMSKAAILKWTELMQEQYPAILFKAIQPGSVATIMGDLKFGDNIVRKCNILNHPALPEEIAALAAFLASEWGGFVNDVGVIASACEVL